MQESWVNLSCPRCSKSWSSAVGDLPGSDSDFTCPDCETVASITEFLQTGRDLEIYNALTD